MTDLTFKAKEDELKVIVCDRDQEFYEISCINRLHFYTVCFMARKLKEGENVDMAFFQPLK